MKRFFVSPGRLLAHSGAVSVPGSHCEAPLSSGCLLWNFRTMDVEGRIVKKKKGKRIDCAYSLIVGGSVQALFLQVL